MCVFHHFHAGRRGCGVGWEWACAAFRGFALDMSPACSVFPHNKAALKRPDSFLTLYRNTIGPFGEGMGGWGGGGGEGWGGRQRGWTYPPAVLLQRLVLKIEELRHVFTAPPHTRFQISSQVTERRRRKKTSGPRFSSVARQLKIKGFCVAVCDL